jgi:hypothetical protein
MMEPKPSPGGSINDERPPQTRGTPWWPQPAYQPRCQEDDGGSDHAHSVRHDHAGRAGRMDQYL